MEYSSTQGYAVDQSHEMIQHLASLLPVIDLSEWAESQPGPFDHGLLDDQRTLDTIEKVLRTLYIPGKHVLITGDKGVGKTSLIRSLVLKNAQGASPFLKQVSACSATNHSQCVVASSRCLLRPEAFRAWLMLVSRLVREAFRIRKRRS